LRRQVEELEDQLAELEYKNTAIQKEMTKEENLTSYSKLADMQKELDENKAKQDKIEEQWTEKSIELEDFK